MSKQVGRSDMTKYKTSQQTKPLLLPLGFTKTFQTSEVSPNYFSFCLQIHRKTPPKRKHWNFHKPRNTLSLLRQAVLLDHCHTNAAATGLACNYAAPGTEPEKWSSSAFHDPWKLQVVSSPPPPRSFFSAGIKDYSQLGLSIG